MFSVARSKSLTEYCRASFRLQSSLNFTTVTQRMNPNVPTYIDSFPIHKLIRPTLGKEMPKIVLVSCGSFSPITNLHLLLFEAIRNYLTKDAKLFEVVGGIVSPVHDMYGKKSLVPQHHRLNMCELATRTSEWISVSPWEIHQDSWTPTRVVMEHYQSVLDSKTILWDDDGAAIDVKCKLIMGTDVLATFLEPGAWADEDIEVLLGELGIVVLERPEMGSTKEMIASSPLLSKYAHNIIICPMNIENNVSSTKIRTLLRNEMSVKYLIDDEVAKYIYENNLYQANPEPPLEHPKVLASALTSQQ